MATNFAPGRMSIEEFLSWDDPSGVAHELIDGALVAMAPTSKRHGTVAQNIGNVVDRAVRQHHPCRAIQQAGVAIPGGRAGTVLIPDVVMTCEPDSDSVLVEAPRLVIEILSPSTAPYDETYKVRAYSQLPSVEEIWLVGSRTRSVIVWQRRDGAWQAGLPLIGQASFHSLALDATVSLDEIYRLTSLAADVPGGATGAAP